MRYLTVMAIVFFLSACEQYSTDSSADTTRTGTQPAFLQQPLQCKVSQYGLYRMVRNGGVINDAKTTTGKVIASPVIQQLATTQRIPLIKGAQMYLQYRLWSLPNKPAYVNLRRVLKHPQMTLPDGKTTTGSDFMVKRKVSSNHVIVYTGYGFDEDYELVAGDWVFQIWYQDKKLIEQTFTTYWPDKKEIARLKSQLQLGNKVFTKMQSPHHAERRLNWPRVVAGASAGELPAGVTETIRSMEKPIVTP